MRIAEFLRASFVGALLFSPAMADDIEKVHDEALRALREQLGQTSAAQVDPQMAKERAEQRNTDREKLQAERRQQFEQFVKERERLRQQQHEYEVNVARQAGQIKPDDYNPAHSPALVALHQNTEAAMQLAQADAEDVHAKALEVLHQQVQNQSAPATAPAVQTPSTTTSPATSTPQPSPDLQRRLKQMQLELEQEEAQKAKARGDAKPASVTIVPPTVSTTPTPDAYTRELEQRAQSMVEQSPTSMQMPRTTPGASSATANPSQGLDAATREMIRRQDQEISGKMSAPAASTAKAKTPSPASTPLPQTLTSEQEAAALAALRQQEQQSRPAVQTAAPSISNPSSATPAAKSVAPPKAAAVTQRTETDAADVQYSKELEDRARQILLERAQNQQATTAIQAAPAPAPAASPVENPSPVPVQSAAPAAGAASTAAPSTVTPTAAPSAIPAASPDVHSQAQQALEQINTGTVPRTRMERLKEITDLYRADKMTPAEYHQKRAQILAEPQ